MAPNDVTSASMHHLCEIFWRLGGSGDASSTFEVTGYMCRNFTKCCYSNSFNVVIIFVIMIIILNIWHQRISFFLTVLINSKFGAERQSKANLLSKARCRKKKLYKPMQQTVGIEGTEELAYTTYIAMVLIRVFVSKR